MHMSVCTCASLANIGGAANLLLESIMCQSGLAEAKPTQASTSLLCIWVCTVLIKLLSTHLAVRCGVFSIHTVFQNQNPCMKQNKLGQCLVCLLCIHSACD